MAFYSAQNCGENFRYYLCLCVVVRYFRLAHKSHKSQCHFIQGFLYWQLQFSRRGGKWTFGAKSSRPLACKSTPTDLDGNAEYVDFEVNMRRQKHDLKGREKKNTGFLSQIGTKLRDWAVGQEGASCYSWAALSSNDLKTL